MITGAMGNGRGMSIDKFVDTLYSFMPAVEMTHRFKGARFNFRATTSPLAAEPFESLPRLPIAGLEVDMAVGKSNAKITRSLVDSQMRTNLRVTHQVRREKRRRPRRRRPSACALYTRRSTAALLVRRCFLPRSPYLTMHLLHAVCAAAFAGAFAACRI